MNNANDKMPLFAKVRLANSYFHLLAFIFLALFWVDMFIAYSSAGIGTAILGAGIWWVLGFGVFVICYNITPGIVNAAVMFVIFMAPLFFEHSPQKDAESIHAAAVYIRQNDAAVCPWAPEKDDLNCVQAYQETLRHSWREYHSRIDHDERWDDAHFDKAWQKFLDAANDGLVDSVIDRVIYFGTDEEIEYMEAHGEYSPKDTNGPRIGGMVMFTGIPDDQKRHSK